MGWFLFTESGAKEVAQDIVDYRTKMLEAAVESAQDAYEAADDALERAIEELRRHKDANSHAAMANAAVIAATERESALRFELAKAQQEERASADMARLLRDELIDARKKLESISQTLCGMSWADVETEADEDGESGEQRLVDHISFIAEVDINGGIRADNADDARKAAAARAYAAKAELVKMGVWGGE